MTPRGGYRANAGRKPGSATKRTREIADKAAAEGITPLEVMLEAMRRKVAANDYDGAAQHAKDAAPYMHPRLSNVEATGRDGGPIETITMIELVAPEADEGED